MDYDLLPLDLRSAEECMATAEGTIAEIARRAHGGNPSCPTVSTRPVPPYEDEDFTLEVRIPTDMDREQVINVCIQHALSIEDAFGFTILIRVKKETLR